MDKVTLSIQTVNQIMAYLGRQPFQDVFQLVEAVQKEAQAQQPAPEQPAPDAPAE
jgi:hypothetical protein